MGGIKTLSLGVDCDMCKTTVLVKDPKMAKFYRDYAANKAEDDQMFVYAYTGIDGKERSANFEFVCPKCITTLGGVISKLSKGSGAKKKRAAPKKKVAVEPKKAEPKKPEPKKPEPVESTVDDDELFGEY